MARDDVDVCGKCNKGVENSDDALFCDHCETWLHRECLKMTLKSYKQLSKSTKPWNCGTCKLKEVNITSILSQTTAKDNVPKTEPTRVSQPKEVEMEEDISVYQGLLKAVQSLQKSVDFMSNKFDEFQKNHNDLMKENLQLKKVVREIKEENKVLKHRINSLEQESKQSNIVVTGVILQPEENTMQVVQKILDTIGAPMECVSEAYRINGKNTSPILIKAKTKMARKQIMEKRKNKDGLLVKECGLRGPDSTVYFNDDLTSDNQLLFKQAREERKKGTWKYVWCTEGRIYCRKTEDSRAIRIQSLDDLQDRGGPAADIAAR